MVEPELEESKSEYNAWEQTLRRILPAGAPLPDEDQLDYSIAVEYDGPPLPSDDLPTADPVPNPYPNPSRFSKLRNGGSKYSQSPPQYSSYTNTSNSRRSSSQSDADADAEGAGARARAESRRVVRSVTSNSTENDDDGARRVEKAVAFNTPEAEDDVDAKVEVEAEARRAAVANTVSFNTPEVDDDVDGGPDSSGSASPPVQNRLKSGVCYRCGKRNRLKEREACIVCDARYCSNCVLKAMGSMPEGRKCVSCIGRAIDELKRPGLGKCSRMLARVCSPLEVRQIMKAEKECSANQLRPEQLVVNGRQLRQDELAEVLGCAFPPQKLKPGRYWYDKDSGLLGKVNILSESHFIEITKRLHRAKSTSLAKTLTTT